MRDVEVFQDFLGTHYSSELLSDLKNNISWTDLKTKTNKNYKSIFKYNNEELDFIEKLFKYVENKIGTEVIGLWIDYYKSGENYSPIHYYGYDCDYIILNLGATRKIEFTNIEQKKKSFKLQNNDILYFNSNYNKNHKITVPTTTNNEECIQMIFFIEKPYSIIDYENKSRINILGYGKLTVSGYKFPDNTIAVILPNHQYNNNITFN